MIARKSSANMFYNVSKFRLGNLMPKTLTDEGPVKQKIKPIEWKNKQEG